MKNTTFTHQELFSFIDRAGKSTYAGGGERLENPERKDFIELEYSEGDFYYRDSYTGFYRSRGMEIVRFLGKPVWTSAYGGGMTEGNDHLANETFEFLKLALSQDSGGFMSFRGLESFSDGVWNYSYKQEGDVAEYSGYEEIHRDGKLVFFHRIIGGIVKGK